MINAFIMMCVYIVGIVMVMGIAKSLPNRQYLLRFFICMALRSFIDGSIALLYQTTIQWWSTIGLIRWFGYINSANFIISFVLLLLGVYALIQYVRKSSEVIYE